MRDAQQTVDGVLDLHLFRPSQAKALVREYVRLCHEQGVRDVLVIHGRGTGEVRSKVHSTLCRLPEVHLYRTAEELLGGWAATVVKLRPRP